MKIMSELLEPEERAVWGVLVDSAIGDWMTAAEIAAVASVLGHRAISEDVVREVIAPLVRDGHVQRQMVAARRQPRVYAYALTLPGRVRGTRLLRGRR